MVIMRFDVKVVAYILGAIFIVLGTLILFAGSWAVPADERLVSVGWLLVILAAVTWGITLLAKKP